MTDTDDVRLSQLLQELREDGYEAPVYRVFQEAARDGRFLATQRRGLWYASLANKHAIAAAMGMTRAAPTKRQSAA